MCVIVCKIDTLALARLEKIVGTASAPLSDCVKHKELFSRISGSDLVEIDILKLLDENEELKVKLEETKKADRAKLLLLQHRGYSENEAHRFIEKTAMDKRMTRTAVAEEIIIEYANK